MQGERWKDESEKDVRLERNTLSYADPIDRLRELERLGLWKAPTTDRDETQEL